MQGRLVESKGIPIEQLQDPRTALRRRMPEIAQTRVQSSKRKIGVLLNHLGWRVGK
jgi:hypothetical protein